MQASALRLQCVLLLVVCVAPRAWRALMIADNKNRCRVGLLLLRVLAEVVRFWVLRKVFLQGCLLLLEARRHLLVHVGEQVADRGFRGTLGLVEARHHLLLHGLAHRGLLVRVPRPSGLKVQAHPVDGCREADKRTHIHTRTHIYTQGHTHTHTRARAHNTHEPSHPHTQTDSELDRERERRERIDRCYVVICVSTCSERERERERER
mmetsp:Transcript_19050/g.38511  ORF Transcript_19050/g.38511 Transcript_19050/m.38511 type:complete len:208 (-) Transcript_19050:2-625(-)